MRRVSESQDQMLAASREVDCDTGILIVFSGFFNGDAVGLCDGMRDFSGRRLTNSYGKAAGSSIVHNCH
jgi:hypothetical protein